LAWNYEARHGIGYYCLVVADGVLSWGTRALVQLGADGAARWESAGDFADGLHLSGRYIIAATRPVFDASNRGEGPLSYVALDAGSGTEIHRTPFQFVLVAFLVDRMIGLEKVVHADRTRTATIAALTLDPNQPEMIWSAVSRGRFDQVFEREVACSDGRLFVGRGDSVLALGVRTGEEVWLASVADQGGVRRQKLLPMVSEGVLVVATDMGTAAFDVATGRRLWTLPYWGCRTVYGGMVYLIHSGVFYAHDLHDGSLRVQRPILDEMQKKCRGRVDRISTDISASETHIYGGDPAGRLWAFDRMTGEPVWHHRPKRTTGYGAAIPVICGNRLYIASFSMDDERNPPSLYCYEGSAG
jgi:outer membrane protein assembly factor BamB